MAKNQNIALNPNKINGVCGRLLCCLKYEDDTYSECRCKLPNLGSTIAMAFDECIENPAEYEYTRRSCERTLRWLYRCRDKLRIILTPHEHDRMMDEPSLDIIVPAILETVAERSSVQNDC